MGKRVNKYREVKKLPARAMSVDAYADSQRVSYQAIYNRWRRFKKLGYEITFEIVMFNGYPHVIPSPRQKK